MIAPVWDFRPAHGTWLTLGFTEFDTESGYDYLDISTGSWRKSLAGSSVPDAFTVPSSFPDPVTLRFHSDGGVTGAGFIGFYTAAPIPPPPPPPPPCEDDLTGAIASGP